MPSDGAAGVRGSWVEVSTLDDLWDGEMAGTVVGDTPIVLLNVGGEVVAYEDRCPHLGTRLSDGRFNAGVLICKVHEWAFDARDGQGVDSLTCLRRFAVQVNDEVISVNTDVILQEERRMPGMARSS